MGMRLLFEILLQAPPALFKGRFLDGKYVVYGLPARIIGLSLISWAILPFFGFFLLSRDAFAAFGMMQFVGMFFVTIFTYLIFREKYNPATDPTLQGEGHEVQ